MVGWSCATADANSDAPMRSPRRRRACCSSPAAARSCSTVPAYCTVLASMRPWKSLTPRTVSVTTGVEAARERAAVERVALVAGRGDAVVGPDRLLDAVDARRVGGDREALDVHVRQAGRPRVHDVGDDRAGRVDLQQRRRHRARVVAQRPDPLEVGVELDVHHVAHARVDDGDAVRACRRRSGRRRTACRRSPAPRRTGRRRDPGSRSGSTPSRSTGRRSRSARGTCRARR